jgi:hypothetical protein
VGRARVGGGQAKWKLEGIFFSEEKKQKTFMSSALPRSGTWPESEICQAKSPQLGPSTRESTVFCFFSSEKKTLPSFG